MKKKDILLIGAALLAALALWVMANCWTMGEPPRSVVVTIDGAEALRKPLDVDGQYELRQEDGSVNVIAVEKGAVYMKDANCRDHLCVHQGRMRSAAKSIVCLPHKVVVQLSGTSATAQPDDDIDVVIF